MENYIVSARKYRPSTFESVVGQRALTTTLKNAIATQKLAHAYLFCGPRGVGKTTCARIFAKTINCMNLTAEGEACNQCESCVAFNEQRSYNIHELDAASNNSVDDIRQLVEQVRIPPQIGKYKVYIIDEVHMLSASAFNAFLKTLEEPPKHAIFILATTEKHKILPTILSRCQIYDFNRISIEDTVGHLSYVAAKENVNAEPEALNVIALKADGGMRDALSIFDQVVSFTQGNITYQSVIENLNVLDYEYYFRLTDNFLQNNVSEALLLFNDVLNHGFDGSHFITGLSSHFRDLLVARDTATLALLEVGASIRQRYQEQAQKCQPQFLYRAMKLCNDCDMNYRNSKNKRLLVELTLIQVAQITIEGDEAGHGRRPTQIIKPIFTPPATGGEAPRPSSHADTQMVATHVAQQAQGTNPVANGTAAAVRQAPVIPPAPKAGTMNGNSSNNQGETPESAKKEEPKPQHLPDFIATLTNAGTTSRVIPRVTPEAISTSARKIMAYEQARLNPGGASNGMPQQQQAPVQERDFPFDESELNFYWQEFAALLPQEHTAMAMRMQNMRVKLTDKVTFEVVLDNEYVVKEFMPLRPNIIAHLRKQLRNRQVNMTVRISEATEKKMPIGKVERFQAMAQKNEALLQLKEVFGLELW
ncbi:DNA polymerase III subunit gamma/tau [Bacteroides sp. 51]|uniref:DNA polymerase III subunit gamma/tau n=1 Tax=Bacteroides sp. 51 TaxID=2302938 RepID=UPI0013D8D41D|nr:DNA polymerase III subunit gamma/tau [Bacteroides sp. 51]NDV83614.1 DNA polymerase III subunit gamma/tau [Bacteroides sp. 51]